MKPYEEQQIYNLFQNNSSFLFWSKKYDQIDYNNTNTYIQTYNFENVNSNLNIYKQKIVRYDAGSGVCIFIK